MQKLKIALYTPSFPPITGGIATSHYNIYNLLKNDFKIKLFVYNENTNIKSKTIVKKSNKGLLYSILKPILKLYLFINFKKRDSLTILDNVLKVYTSVKKLNVELHKFNPHIIIIPDNFIPAYGLKKPVNSKLFWFARHNYSRFMDNPIYGSRNTLEYEICMSMEKKAAKKADFFVSPSKYMIDVIERTISNNKPKVVINNFIIKQNNNAIDYTSIIRILEIIQKVPTIYIPSAGIVVKGKRYIFEIVRRINSNFNNIAFYLSGKIPKDLQFELNTIDTNKILMPGHLDWNLNFEIVKNCTIGITPNLVENFSNAILEAQLEGVPFVAFDTGGNKEIITHEKSGFIVPQYDIEALIEKSCYLLQNDKILSNFKEYSKTSIQRRIDPIKIKQQYANLFNQR